jgi:hypothetical protein
MFERDHFSGAIAPKRGRLEPGNHRNAVILMDDHVPDPNVPSSADQRINGCRRQVSDQSAAAEQITGGHDNMCVIDIAGIDWHRDGRRRARRQRHSLVPRRQERQFLAQPFAYSSSEETNIARASDKHQPAPLLEQRLREPTERGKRRAGLCEARHIAYSAR